MKACTWKQEKLALATYETGCGNVVAGVYFPEAMHSCPYCGRAVKVARVDGLPIKVEK